MGLLESERVESRSGSVLSAGVDGREKGGETDDDDGS